MPDGVKASLPPTRRLNRARWAGRCSMPHVRCQSASALVGWGSGAIAPVLPLKDVRIFAGPLQLLLHGDFHAPQREADGREQPGNSPNRITFLLPHGREGPVTHDGPCCSSGREPETTLANCHWALTTTTKYLGSTPQPPRP
jgi:hypothetical protein